MSEVTSPQPPRAPRSPGRLVYSILRFSGHIPYAIGSRLLNWLCCSRLAQRLFFRSGLNVTRRFLPYANPGLNPQEVMQRSLAANFLGSWRLLVLDRSPADEFSRWVTVRGAEHVTSSYSKESGLIVVNGHYGIPRLAPVAVSRLGYKVLSLEAVDLFSALNIGAEHGITVMSIGGKEGSKLLREVYRARRALEDGEVLHLAADGSFGSSGIDFPLHGRARPFAAGFAELAIATGARVVPVFAAIAADGHLTIDFLEPFDTGEGMEHKARVRHLIGQYVSTLEQRYREDPGNVRWVHYRRFFKLPVSQEGGAVAAPTVK